MGIDAEPRTEADTGPRAATPGRSDADLPLISVVVPCLNRAHYLAETVDSILSQDYPALECIVVDAGSTDGTIDILRSYGDRIRWISEPDGGAFDAINKGWAMSRGSVVAWLNADDRWEPGAARKAGEYFAAHPGTDVLYGDCGGIDPSGRLLQVFPARAWDFPNAVLNCDHVINQAAAFMRREAVERVGWLYPAWCHDHDLWLRMAAAGAAFAALHEHLASARIQDGNLGNVPQLVIPAKVALTRRFFELPYVPRELRGMRRRALSNAWVRGFDYLNPRRRDHWEWGWRCLREAFSADPLNAPHVVAEVVSRLEGAGLRTAWGRDLHAAGSTGRRTGARALRAGWRLAGSQSTAIMLYLILRELRRMRVRGA